jgi:hypothetical protein
VWAARTMLSTLAEGVIPFEVEWAIENGMEIIGEEIDETTLDGIDDDE